MPKTKLQKIIAGLLTPLLLAAAWMVYSSNAQTTDNTAVITQSTTGYFLSFPSVLTSDTPIRFKYGNTSAKLNFIVGSTTNTTGTQTYEGQYLGEEVFGFNLPVSSMSSGYYIIKAVAVFEGAQSAVLATRQFAVQLASTPTTDNPATYTNNLVVNNTINEITNSSTTIACQFSYTNWSECQNGWQVRELSGKTPENCNYGVPELRRPCTICTADIWQCGDWSACSADGFKRRSCVLVKDCPSANNIEEVLQKCSVTEAPTNLITTSTTTSTVACEYKLSDWSACANGKQNRKILEKHPVDCQLVTQDYPVLEKTCVEKLPLCAAADWSCGEWGACLDGYRKRDCKLLKNCQSTDSTKPKFMETCTVTSPKETTSSTANTSTANIKQKCVYQYSDWSVCQNGTQVRKILNVKPVDCQGSPELLNRVCQETATCQQDEWKCSAWSDCAPNQQAQRICELVFDCPNQTTVRPAVVRGCQYNPDKQLNNSTDKPKEVIDDASSKITTTAAMTTQEAVAAEAKNNEISSQVNLEKQLPLVCMEAGLTNPGDCELYFRQTKVVGECVANKLPNKEACRRWLFERYGRPLRCSNLNEEQCLRLIDEVILSDWRDPVISNESKKTVETAVGSTAVINNTLGEIVITQPNQKTAAPVKLNVSPFAPSAKEVKVFVAAATTDDKQSSLMPAVILLDDDGDGLANELERRLGTNPNQRDTDGDGYDDATEVRSGNDPLLPAVKKTSALAAVDLAIINGRPLEHPKFKDQPASQTLKVTAVMTTDIDADAKTGKLKVQGTAKPNETVTLYIYSVMPIVITVQADANGNWVYDLDKTLVDGKHEVYVAINDDQGKIQELSNPAAFLVKEAKAVTLEEFTQIEDATYTPDATKSMLMFYIISSVALIAAFVSLFLVIRRKING